MTWSAGAIPTPTVGVPGLTRWYMALGLPLTCGPAASEAIEGTHGRSRVAVPASGGSAHTPLAVMHLAHAYSEARPGDLIHREVTAAAQISGNRHLRGL